MPLPLFHLLCSEIKTQTSRSHGRRMFGTFRPEEFSTVIRLIGPILETGFVHLESSTKMIPSDSTSSSSGSRDKKENKLSVVNASDRSTVSVVNVLDDCVEPPHPTKNRSAEDDVQCDNPGGFDQEMTQHVINLVDSHLLALNRSISADCEIVPEDADSFGAECRQHFSGLVNATTTRKTHDLKQASIFQYTRKRKREELMS